MGENGNATTINWTSWGLVIFFILLFMIFRGFGGFGGFGLDYTLYRSATSAAALGLGSASCVHDRHMKIIQGHVDELKNDDGDQ